MRCSRLERSRFGANEGVKVLYILYNGALDSLGQSQVLPYLREIRFLLLPARQLRRLHDRLGLRPREGW